MKIILGRDVVARIEGEVVFDADSPLILNFESNYDLSKAVIHLKNGTKQAKKSFFKNLVVPKDLLFEGRLLVQVDMYLDGALVKTWQVPPIRIVEKSNTQFDGYPEFEKLITMYNELNCKFIALNNELKTHIEKSNEII